MITFATPISETELLPAYNNSVVVFSSNLPKTPTKAEIVIGANTFTYYPHPDKTFYVNFKDWFTALINTDNFADELQTDLTIDHIYDWTAKSFLELAINFKITFTDSSFEDITKNVQILNAYIQEEDYKNAFPMNASVNDSFVMSPYQKASLKHHYLKMWSGMPFDLTIYTGNATTIDILNKTNLLTASFPVKGKVNRVVFCDGAISTSINDVLSIVNGYNQLTINGVDLTVEMNESICDGVYLKWLNSDGGFNYWMFPKGERSRPIKTLGTINNDFKNLNETTSVTTQIGKTSFDTIKISSGTLTEEENRVLKEILDSVKVYFFTGIGYEMNSYTDWLEVEVNNTSAVVERAKTTNNEYQISIDLPRRNTRTL